MKRLLFCLAALVGMTSVSDAQIVIGDQLSQTHGTVGG